MKRKRKAETEKLKLEMVVRNLLQSNQYSMHTGMHIIVYTGPYATSLKGGLHFY